MKTLSELFLGLGLGIAATTVAFGTNTAIKFTGFEVGMLLLFFSISEEIIKFIVSKLTMYFASVGSFVAVGIGVGFGFWEFVLFTWIRGVAPTQRIEALLFHTLTGVILWFGLKSKNTFWWGIALGLNLVLHLGFNFWLIKSIT